MLKSHVHTKNIYVGRITSNMPIKKKLACLCLVILFFSLVPSVEGAVEDNLAIIDHFEHSADDFQRILNHIHTYHPDYSIQQIGDMIAKAYSIIDERAPGRYSIWNIARGIENAAACEESRNINLAEIIAAYIMLLTY